jgi:hypothetical protein
MGHSNRGILYVCIHIFIYTYIYIYIYICILYIYVYIIYVCIYACLFMIIYTFQMDELAIQIEESHDKFVLLAAQLRARDESRPDL